MFETNFCSKNSTKIHKAVDISKGILTISIKEKVNQSNIHRWKKTQGPKQRDPRKRFSKGPELQSELGFEWLLVSRSYEETKVSKKYCHFSKSHQERNQGQNLLVLFRIQTWYVRKEMASYAGPARGKTIVCRLQKNRARGGDHAANGY